MTRRRLLHVLLAALCLVALLLVWRLRGLREILWTRLRPRLDPASPTGRLAPSEERTLLAFAEVVVEGRPALSPARRQHLLDHITGRTEGTAGYLALYRMTAQLCDRLGEGRFAELELRDRQRLIAARILTSDRIPTFRDGRAAVASLLFRRQELAVATLAVPDLIRGYYASPAGWGVVGYTAFPGRCGGLVRYTLPEPRTDEPD